MVIQENTRGFPGLSTMLQIQAFPYLVVHVVIKNDRVFGLGVSVEKWLPQRHMSQGGYVHTSPIGHSIINAH